MPFGKYKGYQVNTLPLQYIEWLSQLQLKNPLKSEVNKIINSDEFLKYQTDKLKAYQRYEEEREMQRKLEEDYIKDIKFWGRVSPNSVIETIRKNDIDIDNDTWRWLLRNSEKTPFQIC